MNRTVAALEAVKEDLIEFVLEDVKTGDTSKIEASVMCTIRFIDKMLLIAGGDATSAPREKPQEEKKKFGDSIRGFISRK